MEVAALARMTAKQTWSFSPSPHLGGDAEGTWAAQLTTPTRDGCDPDAHRACESFVDTMTRLTLVEIRARYAFARCLHAVRYSPNALESMRTIAKRTALHTSVLRRFARVAEGVPPADLDEFTNLRTPRGLPLTWSHLEELATVRNRVLRRDLAAAAALEGLSVRHLRQRIRLESREGAALTICYNEETEAR